MSRTIHQLLLAALVTASHAGACPLGPAARTETYVVRPGDTLSELLSERGIGRPGSEERLYGPDGWVELNRRVNHLGDAAPTPGQTLRLLLPGTEARPADGEAAFATHDVGEGESLASIARRCGVVGGLARLRELNPTHAAGAANADRVFPGEPLLLEVPAEALVSETEPQRAPAPAPPAPAPPAPPPAPPPPPPPPPKLAPEEAKQQAAALSDEKIAELSPAEAEALPPEVKEEKAWDASFLDSLKPGMDRVFSGLSSTTASAYVGVRYGRSLARPGTPLTPKLATYGLMAELRGGVLDGVRFYFDDAPAVHDAAAGLPVELGFRRYLFGYAFAFDFPWLVDEVHLTPKLGRYTVAATLPAGIDPPSTRTFGIDGAPSVGLELDAEKTGFFYILRGWAAKDQPVPGLGHVSGGKTVASTRAGADLFLKGPGFDLLGARASLHYLLFVADEQLALSSEQAGESDGLTMNLPFAGLGLDVAW